eukprot:1591409-Rhodomonas_salina.1
MRSSSLPFPPSSSASLASLPACPSGLLGVGAGGEAEGEGGAGRRGDPREGPQAPGRGAHRRAGPDSPSSLLSLSLSLSLSSLSAALLCRRCAHVGCGAGFGRRGVTWCAWREQEKMTKAGTKELAEVRQRLKRGARKVMEKLQVTMHPSCCSFLCAPLWRWC